MNTTIQNIPLEILIIILKYLDFDSRKECKLVCRFWFDVLMTDYQFKEDRHLFFANCLFDKNVAPVSVFMKSKYKYETACILRVKETKLVIKDDISDEFWHKIGIVTLQMDNILTLWFCYSEISRIRSLQNLEIFCDYYVTDLYEWNNYVESFCFPQITNINIKNSIRLSEDDRAKFTYIFPNLQKLWIENKCSLHNKLPNLPILQVKKVWVENSNYAANIQYNYENLVSEQNLDISNFYQTEPDNSIMVYKLELSPYYYNQFTITDNTNSDVWNKYQNVKQLSVTIYLKGQCFFSHRILSFPLETLDICISTNDTCLICLNSLYNSFKKIKILKLMFLNDYSTDYIDFTLIFDKWKYLNEFSITMYNADLSPEFYKNFFKLPSLLKYNSMKTIYMHIPYLTDLTNFMSFFPNLQTFYFKLHTQLQFDYMKTFKSLISINNCQLKKLKFHVFYSKQMNEFQNESSVYNIADHIVKYGKKLRVSVFCLVFSLQILLFFILFNRNWIYGV